MPVTRGEAIFKDITWSCDNALIYFRRTYIPTDIHNGIYLRRGARNLHQLGVTSRRTALLDLPPEPLQALSGREGRATPARRSRKKEGELLQNREVFRSVC